MPAPSAEWTRGKYRGGFVHATMFLRRFRLLERLDQRSCPHRKAIWRQDMPGRGHRNTLLTFASPKLLRFQNFVLNAAGTEETFEDSLAAELIPKEQHGMAFGTLAAVNAVGDFCSSIIVGILWSAFSVSAAFTSFGCPLPLELASSLGCGNKFWSLGAIQRGLCDARMRRCTSARRYPKILMTTPGSARHEYRSRRLWQETKNYRNWSGRMWTIARRIL